MYCIPKDKVLAFKKALRSGELDVQKLADMETSEARRNYLSKFIGKGDAQKVNALFESKLLLKNFKTGAESWVKQVVGANTTKGRDMITKIEGLQKILSPLEGERFLQDLASAKLGVNITPTEAKVISEMSVKNQELKAKILENAPIRSKERLEYGVANTLLKDYVSRLKGEAQRISFREQPARKILDVTLKVIPDLSQTIRTAYDNSFWLRQANNLLFTPRYSKIWAKNFAKSWVNLGKELKGQDAMLAIKADIYSRPNALNGKYNADPTGYGLGVISEEVYSSRLPAKIPILGRLFKGSESMFNGGALQVRADLADLEIKAAEAIGLDPLDKKVASSLGSMVTSLSGRGSVGGAESFLRKLFWAPRMYAATINRLTAHIFDPKATAYTKKQAAKNLITRLGTTALLFVLAKALDPNSVDEKDHLGKIKIWGKWADVTGGDAGWVNLVKKMSNRLIGYIQGKQPKYGENTAMDDLEQFAEGKASPIAGVIRDLLKGKLYNGDPITLKGLVITNFTPITYQSYQELAKDPTASNILGLIVLEELGVNVSSYLESNTKTELIPTKTVIKNDNFLTMIQVYAKAIGTDPETAFNRIFTGQKILQVSGGGIIVVERQSVTESEAFKKQWIREHGGKIADMKEVKLDHTIPNKLGGEEKPSNWKIVTTSVWSSYTNVENSLIQAVKDKKVSLKEAQTEIVEFKSIDDTTKRKKYGEILIQKYK